MTTIDRRNYVPREERVRKYLEAASPINEPLIHALASYRSLALGPRFYRVAPISYTDGVQLHRLGLRLAELDATYEATELWADRYRDTLAECLRIARKLLIPTSGWRRWAWKLFRVRGNPLRRASEQEIAAVVRFLAMCRTNAQPRVRLGLDASRN